MMVFIDSNPLNPSVIFAACIEEVIIRIINKLVAIGYVVIKWLRRGMFVLKPSNPSKAEEIAAAIIVKINLSIGFMPPFKSSKNPAKQIKIEDIMRSEKKKNSR